MNQDYYQLLGVSRTATGDEIRQAFRRLARELHPDVNTHPDATAQFQRVNEAYHVLSDPGRRSAYDRKTAAPRVRTRPAPRPESSASTPRPAASTPRPAAPKPRPAASTPPYSPPDWPPPNRPPTYRADPKNRYQYSWERKTQPEPPAWIPRLAALARHFIASGYFWVFIIIQFVAIIALPTGAPILGTTGWTIVWLGSFVLPVVAIVTGVRKTAE